MGYLLGLCTRPGCFDPARHQPLVAGEPLDGWERLCCAHANQYMTAAALSVDPDEGLDGLDRWITQHVRECGA